MDSGPSVVWLEQIREAASGLPVRRANLRLGTAGYVEALMELVEATRSGERPAPGLRVGAVKLRVDRAFMH